MFMALGDFVRLDIVIWHALDRRAVFLVPLLNEPVSSLLGSEKLKPYAAGSFPSVM